MCEMFRHYSTRSSSPSAQYSGGWEVHCGHQVLHLLQLQLQLVQRRQRSREVLHCGGDRVRRWRYCDGGRNCSQLLKLTGYSCKNREGKKEKKQGQKVEKRSFYRIHRWKSQSVVFAVNKCTELFHGKLEKISFFFPIGQLLTSVFIL